MIIACSKGADNAASNIMLIRNQDNDMVDVTDFQNPVVKRLTTSRGCQNSMIHPENGELYYNFFGSGAVLRYDFTNGGQMIIKLMQKNCLRFRMPTGNLTLSFIHLVIMFI